MTSGARIGKLELSSLDEEQRSLYDAIAGGRRAQGPQLFRLVDDRGRLEGKHFISIGSFTPSMQELPDAVYELAGHVVIDAEAAQHEVGDVINPLAKGLIQPSSVHELGHVIRGDRKIDTTCTTVFKSVGMALFDLYAAKMFVEAALAQGVGQNLDLQG